MADSFNDREKGYEAKFQHDETLRFKAESRRNKLLGLWLAGQFGMTASEKDAYAKEVVMADLDEPGVEDVVRKVMKDIKTRGSAITEAQVRKQIEVLGAEARRQVATEG